MRGFITYILYFSFFIITQISFAQTKVNVVTRKIENEYAFNNKKLLVNAEKASINIQSWDNNKVKVWWMCAEVF